MRNNQFRTPLLQSGAVLAVIVFVISLIPSSETFGVNAGITSVFWGLLYTILFPFALIFALIFSLAVLTAIFLGAVASYSPAQAAVMYSALRVKLAQYWREGSDLWKNSTNKWCAHGISVEEHTRLKNELAVLLKKNNQLELEISALLAKNHQLQDTISKLNATVADNQNSDMSSSRVA